MTAIAIAPFAAEDVVAGHAPRARRVWERCRFVVVGGLYWGGVAAGLILAWRIAFGVAGCVIA